MKLLISNAVKAHCAQVCVGVVVVVVESVVKALTAILCPSHVPKFP